MDEEPLGGPEDYHPPLSPASGAETLFLAGLTTITSPDVLSSQLRRKHSGTGSSNVSLNTTATDDFMSAAGTEEDLLAFDEDTIAAKVKQFSIPELDSDNSDDENMPRTKKNTKVEPTPLPPKPNMSTTASTTETPAESHPDAAANVYEGAKGVWAWGKGVAVFSPFMGIAEAVAGKALEVAGTNLEELDGNIKPQLKNLDAGVLNPAIETVAGMMLGAAGKATEVVKPIIVLVLSPFKMLEQQPSNETPEVTN